MREHVKEWRCQAWVGVGPPDRAAFLAGRAGWLSERSCNGKKVDRAFYTSTWLAGARSTAWLDFRRERGCRRESGLHVWKLVVPDSVVPYVVSDVVSWDRLAERWPLSGPRRHWMPVDWAAMCRDEEREFAAVNMTAEACFETGSFVCHHWDVESTLWLEWEFEACEDLGELDIDGEWIR